MRLLPPLHLVGANGIPGGTYKPLLSYLQSSYITAYSDVYQEAQGANWGRALDHLVNHLQKRVDEAGTPLIGLGHSLGGAMLILISTRHPHLFQQLIVLDPPMFCPTKRKLLALMNRSERLQKMHPLIGSTYRKRNHFPTQKEAIAYISSRRLYQKFHPHVMDAFVECGIVRSVGAAMEGGGGGGGWSYTFSPEAERFFYVNTPYDIPPPLGPPAQLMGQYDATSVPGHFFYSTRYDFLNYWDIRHLKQALPFFRFHGMDWEHFQPLQQPQQVAQVIFQAMTTREKGEEEGGEEKR